MADRDKDTEKKANRRDKKDEMGSDDYSQSFFEKRVNLSRRLAEQSKRGQNEGPKPRKTPLSSSTTSSSKHNIPRPRKREMTDEEFARMISLSNFGTGTGSSSVSTMREWDSLPSLSVPRAAIPGRNASRGTSARGGTSIASSTRRDALRRKESRKDSSRESGNDRPGSSRRGGAGGNGSGGGHASAGSTSNQ